MKNTESEKLMLFLVVCQFAYSFYNGIFFSFSPLNCLLGLSEKLILYSFVIK